MEKMKEKGQYFVLKEKAVPDVLLRVVEAKRLIDSGKIASVQEAAVLSVGMYRTSLLLQASPVTDATSFVSEKV